MRARVRGSEQPVLAGSSGADRVGDPSTGLSTVTVSTRAKWSAWDAQLALAASRAVDLAQLVVVSTFLFSHAGVTSVAAFGVVRTVAPMVGVPVVLAFGHRVAPGVLLHWMATVAAACSVALAVLAASSGPTAAILVGAALVGVALGCFRPLVRALLPSLARSDAELLRSNALTGFLGGASGLAGPALGSLIAFAVGVPALLAATAVVMVAAGTAASRIPSSMTAVHRPSSPLGGDRAGYCAGVHEVVHNSEVRLIGLLGMTQTAVRGAVAVIAVVFAANVLETAETGAGVLFAAMGVGALVVLPVMPKVVGHVGVHRAVTVGLALWGAPLAVSAFVGHLGGAVVMFAVVGVGDALVDIGYYGVLQRTVSSLHLARVLGVIESMFQAGVAVGSVAGTLLVRHIGPQHSMLVCGCMLSVVAIATARRMDSLQHDLRRRDAVIAPIPHDRGAERRRVASAV